MDYKERLSHFRRIVNSPEVETVDLHRLAGLALRGIPDENSLRPRTWKLLFRLLPPTKSEWQSLLYQKRCQYYNFVIELLAEPDSNDNEDHPLNSAATSKWSTFFHDNDILEQIDKDVRRTNPDLAWFQTPVPTSPLSPLSPPQNPMNPKSSFDSLRISSPLLTPPPKATAKYPTIHARRSLFRRITHLNTSFGARERSVSAQGSILGEEENEIDLHWEAIERILFIYAKLNPAIGYVQGMNELIAPLYYVLAQDESEENSAHTEADTFHLFTALMSSLHSIFIRPAVSPAKPSNSHVPATQLSHHGMSATLKRFSSRLRARDPELASDLDEKGLETTFYAFRWFTCLAPGGLGLPDTIRLWDSLFADWSLEQENNPSEGDEGFRFLEDFGLAVLVSHREELLEGGFSENITLLQRRPVEDLAKTLALAYSIREERVTNTLNEENESSAPPTPSSSITGRFKFGRDEVEVRKIGSNTSMQPAPAPNGTITSRWGRGFFKSNSSTPQVNIAPKTPPPPELTSEDNPSKFSPGSWGASLSAASRKFNKVRLTSGSSDTSPTSSKSAVHLDDRQSVKDSTISARVTAVVRDSFDRRNEIISKVGGWVANTPQPESGRNSITDWEEVSIPETSAANDEIKRLEGEIGKNEKKSVSPEEYIAKIKRRREERESREIQVTGSSGIDDPLGVGMKE